MMEQFLRRLEWVVDRAAYLLALLAAASTALLTFVVTYGVIMRFVFNDAQSWTDELATYSLLWMVFFGLAYTLITGTHIRIDFFTAMLPSRVQHVLEICVWAIGILFASFLILGCLSETFNFIRRHTRSIEGMDIPLWWPAAPMVVGAVLFGIVMVIRLLNILIVGRLVISPEDSRFSAK